MRVVYLFVLFCLNERRIYRRNDDVDAVEFSMCAVKVDVFCGKVCAHKGVEAAAERYVCSRLLCEPRPRHTYVAYNI